MNRLSGITNQFQPTQEVGSVGLQETFPTPAISYTKTDFSISKKMKHSALQFFLPVWVLSPFFCIFKLFKGSLETRVNLFLVLIYQYFFHRKTKLFRRILGELKTYEYFDGYHLVFEDKSSLKSNGSLFPFHPHGIACYGMNCAAQAADFFKDAEVVGSRMSFEYPWGGLVMKFYGVEGANPENFQYLMQENKNLMFVPGGFEEATITRYGQDRVFIKHRKGFIKLALEFGYTVHPCYIFGENKLFYTYSNETLGLLLNKLKMPGLMAYSKNGILPNENVVLWTIVGKGIKMPVIPHPTQEQVDKYHKIYIEKLVELYDRWKGRCGGSEKLEIL